MPKRPKKIKRQASDRRKSGSAVLDRLDLEDGEYVHYGHAALHELNDNRNSGIDLLVREAIQNSADAAPQRAKLARVEFDYSDFSVDSLEGILDVVTLRRWRQLRKPKEGVSLAIRDYGDGLSGPASITEVPKDEHQRPIGSRGNFIKLTKTIGQAQDRSMAGGAFGVGKTIFYRISELPVMFYSRFKGPDLKFHERLLFCIIEDETNRDKNGNEKFDHTLLQNATGFAWWGKLSRDEILPIEEDDDRLAEILEKTGIRRYTTSETGTTIFMPMVKEGQLPPNPGDDDGGAPLDPPPWLSPNSDAKAALMKFTRFSIQRWYAPRLGEEDYPYGPGLEVFVNRKKVIVDKPLFQLVKELYWAAHERPFDDRVRLIPISIRQVLLGGGDAGTLAVVRIPNGDHLLRMRDDGGDYSAAEVQASDYPRGMRRPVIALVRSPGMVVSYQCGGDPWVLGVQEDTESKVVGVFVLNSNAQLKKEFSPYQGSDKKFLLEDYVRFNEGHAHNRWKDEQAIKNAERPELFRKLISTVSRKINAEFYGSETDPANRGGAELVSAELAKLLLPDGFGSGANEKSGPKRGTILRTKRGGAPAFLVTSTNFEKGNVLSIDYELNTGSPASFKLSVAAASDSGTISKEAWHNEISGVHFPFSMETFETKRIKQAGKTGKPAKFEHILSAKAPSCLGAGLEIQLDGEASVKFSTRSGTKMDPHVVEGTIRLATADRAFLAVIHISCIQGLDLKPPTGSTSV